MDGVRARPRLCRGRRSRRHARHFRRRPAGRRAPRRRCGVGHRLHGRGPRLVRALRGARGRRAAAPGDRADGRMGCATGRVHRPARAWTRRGPAVRGDARQGGRQPPPLRPAHRLSAAGCAGMAGLTARPGRAVHPRAGHRDRPAGLRGMAGRGVLRGGRGLAARPLQVRSGEQGPDHGPRSVELDPAPQLLRRLLRLVGSLPDRVRRLGGHGGDGCEPAGDESAADQRERKAHPGTAAGATPPALPSTPPVRVVSSRARRRRPEARGPRGAGPTRRASAQCRPRARSNRARPSAGSTSGSG